MQNKKIAVIGAGITGLAVGCYLQMNDYDTEIFELHNLPGGLCTGWKRKGYTFDGCIHWLCGSSPQSELYTIWDELGALKGKQIVDHEIFVHTDLGNGESFSVYADTDKLQKEMLRFAPEDEKLIKELISAINKLKKLDMPVLKPMNLMGLDDGISFLLKSLSSLGVLRKWVKISMSDLQKMFKSPFFNNNFTNLFGLYGEMPAIAILFTLAWINTKSAGYPIGGSLEFSKSIENRYNSLGGKIHYNSKVEKVLVENNKAIGLTLSDGSKYFSDIVISAADGHYTIFGMLDGKYTDSEIDGYYKNFKLFPPIIQASFGIAREFKNIPDAITNCITLDEPLYIDPKNSTKQIGFKIYNFDPTLAPAGKTSVTAIIEADYEYWTNLKNEKPEEYEHEKERIANVLIDILDRKYGDIKSNVEVYDIATPSTYVRYTNNWLGSFEGFLPTVDNAMKKLKTTLPNLDNFYMIGQWVQPGGGLPTGGMHGRHLAQIICKKDKKKFKTLI